MSCRRASNRIAVPRAVFDFIKEHWRPASSTALLATPGPSSTAAASDTPTPTVVDPDSAAVDACTGMGRGHGDAEGAVAPAGGYDENSSVVTQGGTSNSAPKPCDAEADATGSGGYDVIMLEPEESPAKDTSLMDPAAQARVCSLVLYPLIMFAVTLTPFECRLLTLRLKRYVQKT
jgi:hypothetical protein